MRRRSPVARYTPELCGGRAPGRAAGTRVWNGRDLAMAQADNPRMDLSAKLQIKPDQRVATVAATDDVPSIAAEGAKTADPPDTADVIMAFVRSRADLEAVAVPAIEAARRQAGVDRLLESGPAGHRSQPGHPARIARRPGRPAGAASRHRPGVVGRCGAGRPESRGAPSYRCDGAITPVRAWVMAPSHW